MTINSLRGAIKQRVIAQHKYAPALYNLSLKSKRKQPFICIITPVFDPALDSLKNLVTDLKKQSFGSFIHIVVSNGSSDRVKKYFDKISKQDKRFLYDEISHDKTLSFESILSNSGKRREYALKKYSAQWFHFLDSDVRITDKDYFAKLFMAQKLNKTNLLLVKTFYHGRVYPLQPLNKEGHITISNYIFSDLFDTVGR